MLERAAWPSRCSAAPGPESNGAAMIADLLATHLRDFRAARILDAGPGFNDFARTAAAVTGAVAVCYLDCNREVLACQAERAHAAGLAAECVEGLCHPEAISALPGEFDLILCQEMLEHLEDAEAVAGALAAKLRRGGRMVITVPTRTSERWLRFINRSYMRDEPHGHVREFDREGLRRLVLQARLSIRVLVPAQPHYFLAHTWLFGTRVKIDGSTGRILAPDWRVRVGGYLLGGSLKLFRATDLAMWSRLLPRNYFLVAEKGGPDAAAD
jgi:SAM-dependent methyltransferase